MRGPSITFFFRFDLFFSVSFLFSLFQRMLECVCRACLIQHDDMYVCVCAFHSFCTLAVLSSQALMPEITSRIRLAWACYNVQTGAVRHGICPFHSKSVHANGRGDEDLAVGVCDVDSRPGALHRTPNGTSQTLPADHWFPAPTTHRPHHVVRQARPSRRHNAGALRRPPAMDASSLRGAYGGRTVSG